MTIKSFKKAHGPQPVSLLKPVSVRKLRIKFTSSYGGPNPGASEIEIYSEPMSEKKLKGYLRRLKMRSMPWGAEVGCEELGEFIDEQVEQYGEEYGRAKEHAGRLEELAKSSEDVGAELSELQREVLLFDVDKIVVIKRHEIVATHVYTYHYEGFKAGGGLYVVSLNDPDF